jgi:hypothetical protein
MLRQRAWSSRPRGGLGRYKGTVAARDRPPPSSLAHRVVCAVELTVETGSARMQHGSRVGAADGPVPPRRRPSDGWIDMQRRRAWFPNIQTLAGEEVFAEQFWDGSTLYVRFSSDEPWYDSPLMRRSEVPEAFVPYSSPLWLLDALCGARDDAQVVGDEDVRGSATTRIRLTVDSARAVACSPSGLDLPGAGVDAFPAEVWLDGVGRLRRMGCTWPPRRRLRLAERQPHWITTELWDFGTAVDSPPLPERGETVEPPSTSARHNALGEGSQIGSDRPSPGGP